MKIPYKYKKRIPNVFTGFRLILAPIILTFGFLENFLVVLILTILGSLTDLIDGKLARKWNVVSEFGAKLDAVSDKVFVASLLLALIKSENVLVIIVILEIITALLNLYYYSKLKKSETLFIGKIKMTSLFVTLVVAFIYAFTSKLHFLLNGFIYMSINLQVLCIISYTFNFLEKIGKIKRPVLEEVEAHQKIMNGDTIELTSIEELREK